MIASFSLLFSVALCFNVLVSQPNSINLHHYLVSYASNGTSSFFAPTMEDGTPVQAIQLATLVDQPNSSPTKLVLLDFKNGLFSYRLGDNASLKRIVSPAQLPGGSAWDFTTDGQGSAFVANMNPTEVSPFNRKPVIVKFSLATGAYEGTIVNASVNPLWTAITGVTYVGNNALAVSLSTGHFVIIDSTSGKTLHTLSPKLSDVRYVTKLTAAPDGKRYCFASGGISPAHPDQVHCLASLDVGAPLVSVNLETVRGVPSNGTTPSGMTFVSDDEVVVVVTDAELGHTHHLQLVSTTKGFVKGYGSTACDDVLCMPFNGITTL